jgi:hypothetical protein
MELRDRAEKLESRAEERKRKEGEAEETETRPEERFIFASCEHGHFDSTRPMKKLANGLACPYKR